MGLFIRPLIDRKPEPYSSHTFEAMVEEYSRFRETRNILALLSCSVVALMLEIFTLLSLKIYRYDIVFGWGLTYVGLTVGIFATGVRIWASFTRARLNRMLIQEQNLDGAHTTSRDNTHATG